VRSKAGQAVIAKKDPDLTEQQVRDYCEANLAGYKKPKCVVFRADLPKTPVGKILHRKLRSVEKKRQHRCLSATCRKRTWGQFRGAEILR